MLDKAATLVMPGGTLIYGTCTLNADENEHVVFAFLDKNPDFILEKPDSRTIPETFITDDGFIKSWPHKHHTDGSFAAKLKRKE